MSIALLIILGGIVALDATSFGQLMLSRPFVAGTLAGALVGMPVEGAIVGALLEVLSLPVLPVGASRYPDTGTAAVAAAATLGMAGVAASPVTILLVLVYGLAWQRVAGATVIAGRYINERMVRAGREFPRRRLDMLIQHRHIEAMLLDVVRGMAITAAAVLLGVPLLRAALGFWHAPPWLAPVALSAAAAAVLAASTVLFAGARHGRAFLIAGVLCGSLLVLL